MARPDVQSQTGEWIFAAEALYLIRVTCRSERKAESLLKRYLVGGKITARCSQLLEEVDYNRLRAVLPKEGGSRQVKYIGSGGFISQGFWTQQAKSKMESILWRWDSSVFAVKISKSRLSKLRNTKAPIIYPGRRLVAYGVQFKFEAVRRIVTESFSGNYLIVRKEDIVRSDATGDPRWSAISHFEELALSGKLGDVIGPTDRRGWQSEMINQIATLLPDPDGWPSNVTIKRKVKRLREIDSAARSSQLDHGTGGDPS